MRHALSDLAARRLGVMWAAQIWVLLHVVYCSYLGAAQQPPCTDGGDTGYCVQVAAFGCDTDLHVFDPSFAVGSLISNFCPQTCDTCGSNLAECDPSATDSRVMRVMDSCCPGGGHRRVLNEGGHITCSLPETCPSLTCAAEFLSLWEDCSTELGLGDTPGFSEFFAGCQSLADDEQLTSLVTCYDDGTSFQWLHLPCEPNFESSARGWDADPDGDERCICYGENSGNVPFYYDGPQSAAECAHVVCHFDQGMPLYQRCDWDGEPVVTAEPAADNSVITLTSDPRALCVTCVQSGTGEDTGWQWSNLPCSPGIDRNERGFDSDPEGNERCVCHRESNGQSYSYDGPESAAQCGHIICHNYQDEYFYDSCAWEGQVVATATAGTGSSTTLTSDPDLLCNEEVTRPTCFDDGTAFVWSNLPCAPLLESDDRGWDADPDGDERCICYGENSGNVPFYYDGPQSAAECAHVVCHFSTTSSGENGPIFDHCTWDGDTIVTAEPAPDMSEIMLTSDPFDMCVTCENSEQGFVWDNLPCEPSLEWTDRGYDSTPEGDERCTCHSWTSGQILSYDGPTNSAQCGHIICHRYAGQYMFDSCSWMGVVVVTGEQATDHTHVTVTSDPDALCDGVDTNQITCRPQERAADGNGGGWIWENLPCEPSIDIENRGYDNRPDGNERCVCSCSDAGAASGGCAGGMISAYDGPASAEQCAHILCSSPINTVENSHASYYFYHDSCAWDGVVVATSQPHEHETTILSGDAILCANTGSLPDPLSECTGTWAQSDSRGCVAIIDDGAVPCRNSVPSTVTLPPCDGLELPGNWLQGHDDNGDYIQLHETGTSLTLTHDFGGIHGCEDTSDFTDELGYNCEGWSSDGDHGYDCFAEESQFTGWGYTAAGMMAVQQACPRACGSCAGDFTMELQMKITDLDGSAATFNINDGRFGFEGACQCVFTEGGFFGNVLTNVRGDPQSFFIEGELLTFRVVRRGSIFTFWASEKLVHTFESDVDVTSIGLRPHRAVFKIYDWQIIRHNA